MQQEPHDWQVQGDIRPLRDRVLVCDMEHGDQKLASGIIIPDDNGKERGIRPRQCVVYAVGSDITDVQVGQQVLVAHGRWTRGVRVETKTGETKVVRMVDPKDIMGVWCTC